MCGSKWSHLKSIKDTLEDIKNKKNKNTVISA